jgi:hypothetical protein
LLVEDFFTPLSLVHECSMRARITLLAGPLWKPHSTDRLLLTALKGFQCYSEIKQSQCNSAIRLQPINLLCHWGLNSTLTETGDVRTFVPLILFTKPTQHTKSFFFSTSHLLLRPDKLGCIACLCYTAEWVAVEILAGRLTSRSASCVVTLLDGLLF